MALHETKRLRIQAIKRLFILPSIVLIQSCLGGLYAWSAWVPSLKAEFGYTAAQTQLVFLAHGVAGITGPSLGGLLYDATHSYVWGLAVGIAVLVFGFWRTSPVKAFED